MENKDKSLKKTVLSIGGLDPMGNAGITVDIATLRALGIHPQTIISVLTLQTGNNFLFSSPCEPQYLEKAIDLIATYFPNPVVKTGALGSPVNVELVAKKKVQREFSFLVVDPVIKSTSGGDLFDKNAVHSLKNELIPAADLVTPNVFEAQILTGQKVSGLSDMRLCAEKFLEMGASSVLIKGGHLKGEKVTDFFANSNGETVVFSDSRYTGRSPRGTGCALASLVAGYYALGNSITDSIKQGRKLLRTWIKNSCKLSNDDKVLDIVS